MDTRNIVSRRALLKGAPAVAAAALVTMPALATEVPDAVEAAIAQHRRAHATVKAAMAHLDHCEATLDANPRYDDSPRVQYGRLLTGQDRDGNDHHEPLYAYSLQELDRQCERLCSSASVIWGNRMAAAGIEKTRTRYAGLKADLVRKVRRSKRHERNAGLPAAQKALRVAFEAEQLAAVAVLLAPPRNAADAADKVRYMRGKESFKAGWWDAEGLMRAVRHNAGLEA